MPSFPQVPLDVRVEMQLAGVWTQIQASPTGVRGTDKIVITRGRANEQASGLQQASTALMSLNNRDGRYSPRNPGGTYYGKLGRNTPVRVSTIGDGTTSLRVPGAYGADNVSCPDAAGLHITGDIDIRIDVTLANWAQYQTLAQRYVTGGTSNSWILYFLGSGQLRFRWTTGGSSATETAVSPTVNLAQAPGTRLALRVTLAVATGTVTFYTAPTISGSWTQLGATQVLGATSVFAGTLPIVLGETGQAVNQNLSIMAGNINAFQLLSGIGGTAKANPDFTAQSVGTTSFADAAANTWTLNGGTEITNRRYRFHGEVSSFPQKWDVSGSDIWTPIECAGLLRRYQQGSPPVASPIRRAVSASPTIPIIYWPCEDPAGSGSFAVGAGTGQPMLISGSPTLATDTHIGGSAALPTLGNSTWTGTVPTYTASSPNSASVAFVVYAPTTPANGAVIMRVVAGTTRFDFAWSTSGGGGFYVNAYDTVTGALAAPGNDNSATPTAASTGTAYAVQMQFAQSGANIAWGFQLPGSGTSYANLTSRTLGLMSQATVNPNGTLTDTVAGHVGAYNSQPVTFPQESALTGSSGETAGARFIRLCQENGVVARTVGDPNVSPAMGPQGVDTFVNLIQACIDVDNGMLFEPRDVLGLGMRMRSSLFSQASSATLNYAASHLSAVPEPVDDDQLVRNDVTVTRTNGSFARATLVAGTLSVNPPPNGVGAYPDTPTINVLADSQLLDEASWRMHTQTVDESRWPVVTVGMHTPEMVANPTLAQQIQAADVGQVITLTGLPAWLPPNDTRQLLQGITETLANYEFTIALNCSPASPYDVIVLDDPTFARLDTDGSTLHTSVGTGDTTWSVDTTGAATGSPLWTTSAGDFPFDIQIEGEQVTVTNITGTSSPQTFTVTRSVNGVSKSHSSGAAISLQRPFYLSL